MSSLDNVEPSSASSTGFGASLLYRLYFHCPSNDKASEAPTPSFKTRPEALKDSSAADTTARMFVAMTK